MDDLIELGRTGGAYGFRGWVRVFPLETGEVLERVRSWILTDMKGVATPVEVKGLRRHGTGYIAKWDGCDTKEAADAVRAKISVRRADFPDAGEDAVWAVDLIGCRVRNAEGVDLGEVVEVGTNGVQDLLVCAYEREDGRAARFMIPNVKDVYVRSIDVDAKLVEVDWDRDWR